MTWVELGEVIDSMSDVERNKDAIVWDTFNGWFCRINGCTTYDGTYSDEDFSCDIDSNDSWY